MGTLTFPRTMDTDRLARAVRDVQMSVGDFAVLTSDARTVSDCLTLAKEANALALLLNLQADAAALKADTL